MKKLDFNILAKNAVDYIADGGQNIRQETQKVLRGSAGGKIGGNARAKSLPQERRSEIAILAAKRRWSNK